MTLLPPREEFRCESCNHEIQKGQAETTENTLHTRLCPKCARIVSDATADAAIAPKERVFAWLKRNKFEEQTTCKGFYILNGDTNIAVDMNVPSDVFQGAPVIGVLEVNGTITEEGHGVARIDEIRGTIEGIMKSKGAGPNQKNGKKEMPAPIPGGADPNAKAPPVPARAHPEVRRISGSESLPAMRTEAQCGFLAPAATIEEALAAFNLFEQAKTRLLKDSDVLWIGANGRPAAKGQGHPHIKRSGWRKLARFFGINCTIIESEKLASSDAEGNFYIWRTRARAEHPSGGYFEADGVCSSRDPFFSKKSGVRVDPDEADIILKAQTVAFNRAVSDLLGSGEVSADEMKEVR